MKILLTGGAGFLGSHISNRLIHDGHELLVVDDFSTGNKKNLSALEKDARFRLLEHDVRTPFYADVDAILNFACPASPKNYQFDPVKTIETNFLGMINLLHLARRTGARLIQASTSEVYGDPTISPQREDYWGNVNPVGIRSCYDEGKRAAETLCFDYQRQFDVDARVIRIFNTYGPNMAIDDGRVVSNFIVQALRGESLTVYGDGEQTRSFCYVGDLVEGIIKVLNLQHGLSTPINLGNPSEFTMLELASEVINITGSSSTINFQPLPLDDPKQRRPDITLARNLLSWEPRVELKLGLAETVKYFKAIVQ